MSDPEFHPVHTGARPADAAALVERLLAVAGRRGEVEIDLTVVTDTHAGLGRYLDLTRDGAEVVMELHTAQNTQVIAALDPLLPADHRRRPGLGVDDGDGGTYLALFPADAAALAALADLPPVLDEVSVKGLPDAAFDWALVPAAGGERASVHWMVPGWPAVAELDLPPDVKHAGVELSVNAQGLWGVAPDDPGYRLYVVTGRGEEARAAWVARQAGLAVLGGPEHY